MTTITLDRQPPNLAVIAAAAQQALTRVPSGLRVLAAAGMLLFAGQQVSLALQSPAQAIKRELVAAAAETGSLPWNRTLEQVETALGRHFTRHPASIDGARFPTEVTVALQGVDQATCLEATTLARRIEGSVVVLLQGYGSAADCTNANDMVWRIIP
jgi:hypothetical protein